MSYGKATRIASLFDERDNLNLPAADRHEQIARLAADVFLAGVAWLRDVPNESLSSPAWMDGDDEAHDAQLRRMYVVAKIQIVNPGRVMVALAPVSPSTAGRKLHDFVTTVSARPPSVAELRNSGIDEAVAEILLTLTTPKADLSAVGPPLPAPSCEAEWETMFLTTREPAHAAQRHRMEERKSEPAWQKTYADPQYQECNEKVQSAFEKLPDSLSPGEKLQHPTVFPHFRRMLEIESGYGADRREFWERADTPERLAEWIDRRLAQSDAENTLRKTCRLPESADENSLKDAKRFLRKLMPQFPDIAKVWDALTKSDEPRVNLLNIRSWCVDAKEGTAGTVGACRDADARTEAELKVLRRIADSEILLKGPDAYADVAERTGKAALKSLEKGQLIHRPRGKRSGYAATERGKEVTSQRRTIGAP